MSNASHSIDVNVSLDRAFAVWRDFENWPKFIPFLAAVTDTGRLRQALVKTPATGAFMTAAYMTRCIYLTFFGEPRGHAADTEHPPHESGRAIVAPVPINSSSTARSRSSCRQAATIGL